MNRNKQRLELTWIGKDERPQLEPRILLEDPEKSCHARERITENDIFDNKLIFGDNLLALKALEAEYTGKMKCIYIDPPYNTGNAFEHYDDGLEHSIWLGMMRDRLEILHNLLSEYGVIFVQIDDNEHAYLKVLMDQIFGRANFVANIIWRKKAGGGQDAEYFAIEHENILVFKKNNWGIINELEDHKVEDFSRMISNRPAKIMKLEKWGTSAYREDRPSLHYSIKDPEGNDFYPKAPDGADGRWRKKPENLDANHIHWEKRNGEWKPYEVTYFDEIGKKTIKIRSIWMDIGSNTEATKEIKEIFGSKAFDTPKPEKLIEKILSVSTQPGDIVLDSFAGSGTTGTVAHKMGRKWIMVELGEHCDTHIVPRLQKVIDGTDQGGISKAINWKGGGGFRYYRLAPSMLEKDKWGNWVISKDYNPEMLAEAMCKHMGFTYAPDENHYWMHGHSTETDFIYITTEALTHEQLRAISEDVGPNRTLLICCKAFNSKADFDNLTVKKIPLSVLQKCEWGKDDYSLNVANLPQAQRSNEQTELFEEGKN